MASSPTAQRRRLGIELRRLREELGLKGEDVVSQLGWSVTKLSRIETGGVRAHHGDVMDLLDLYEVTDMRLRDALITLARQARKKGWWAPYGDVLPPGFSLYVGLESVASALHVYEQQFIPGILQTADYARALLQSNVPAFSPDEIDRLVAVRMARQELLTREPEPLDIWAVLDEAVIRRQVGGPDVMRAQLLHLVEMAQLPNVDLQVIPFGIGAHTGMNNAFRILEFSEPDQPDIAFLDTITAEVTVEKPSEIKRYKVVFDHLRAMTHSPAEAVALIAAVGGAP